MIYGDSGRITDTAVNKETQCSSRNSCGSYMFSVMFVLTRHYIHVLKGTRQKCASFAGRAKLAVTIQLHISHSAQRYLQSVCRISVKFLVLLLHIATYVHTSIASEFILKHRSISKLISAFLTNIVYNVYEEPKVDEGTIRAHSVLFMIRLLCRPNKISNK